MKWLAQQPLSRVLLIAATWPVIVPLVLYVAAELDLRWTVWREAHNGRMVVAAGIQLNLASPGAVIMLGLPPLALLAAWSVFRRSR